MFDIQQFSTLVDSMLNQHCIYTQFHVVKSLNRWKHAADAMHNYSENCVFANEQKTSSNRLAQNRT